MRNGRESNNYNFDPNLSGNSSPELENTREFDEKWQTPLRNNSVNSTSYYSEAKPSWEKHRGAHRIPIESAKKHYKRESFESLLSSPFNDTLKDTHSVQVSHPKDRRNHHSIDFTTAARHIDKLQVSNYMRRHDSRAKRTKRRGFKSISELITLQNSSVYKVPEFKCSNKPDFSKFLILHRLELNSTQIKDKKF